MKRATFSIITLAGRGYSLRVLKSRKGLLAIPLTVILILFMSHGAAAQPDDDKWQFSITPYLWAPTIINANLGFDIPPSAIVLASPNVDIGSDFFENLDFAFMISGEVRKKKWSVFTDLIYLDLESENTTVKSVNFMGPGVLPRRPPVTVGAGLDAGSNASLEGLLWTLAVGYTLVKAKQGTLDLFGGFRYFGIEATVDWRLNATIDGPIGGHVFDRSGTISQSEDLWDGIIGVRGRINLGKSNWFIPYYLDIGAGTTDLTWQGLLGIAYAFKWVELKLEYRHLYYDTAEDKLIDDIGFSGPGLGATFRF